MKKRTILTVAIILTMAGMAFAADPNNMPNPTAKNPVTSCVNGNFIYLILYAPDIDQRIVASEVTFPRSIGPVIFNKINSWIKTLHEKLRSDQNLYEALAARQKRDAERMR